MGFFDRLFGKKAAPPPPPPPPDISETTLRRVLGDANVKHASGIALEIVDGGTPRGDGRDRVGGVPSNIDAQVWPLCGTCKTPMTFIAQLACGPDDALRFPERGSIAIFLCGSNPPSTDKLCETWDGNGTAVFFVGDEPATPPMFDDEQLRAIAKVQTTAMLHSLDRKQPRPQPFRLPAKNGFASEPVLVHAFRAERREILTCNEPETEEGRDLYHAFLQHHDGVAIEIAAFPHWIQGPEEHACSCGSPMELVVQFDAFDDAINLGDAGRAYVFACSMRCGPRSFLLRWACC
jgi:hypothetical protein